MKTALIFVLSILTLTTVFAQRINLTQQSLQNFCTDMRNITFTFEGSQFEGTRFENLTEFPPEVLSYINRQIMNKPDAVRTLTPLNGITFSIEILYNTTACFNGSVLFNNSELKFVKLYSDPLAGNNNEHIAFHVETRMLGEVLNELSTLQSGEEINPIQVISTALKIAWSLARMFLSGDLSVRPIGGLLKLFDGMKMVLNMPDLSGMGDSFTQSIINQANTPEFQQCVSNLVARGTNPQTAMQQCLQ